MISDMKDGLDGSKLRIIVAHFTPFNTRANRVDYINGMQGIVGSIARKIEKYELSDEGISEHIRNMIDEGIVELDNGATVEELIQLVETYDPSANIIKRRSHELFKLYPLSASDKALGLAFNKSASSKNKEKNSKEQDISSFIYDVILRRNPALDGVFRKESINYDNLTRLLILASKGNARQIEDQGRYHTYLNYFDGFIRDDLQYIVKDNQLFTNTFDKFLAYYTAVYLIQLVYAMDISNKIRGELVPVYWLLDGEKASQHRHAVTNGWKQLKENGYKLWVNNLVLDIANSARHNDAPATFLNLIEDESPELLTRIKNKIMGYKTIGIDDEEIKRLTNVESCLRYLYTVLDSYYSEGTRQGTQSRFFLWIEDFCKHSFLKTRSQYGHTLNLTEDFLIFLTTLVVKDDRVRLKDLFRGFEQRGMYLDEKSKKEVVRILDKQGLLDKKSDSGDAQYIRRSV